MLLFLLLYVKDLHSLTSRVPVWQQAAYSPLPRAAREHWKGCCVFAHFSLLIHAADLHSFIYQDNRNLIGILIVDRAAAGAAESRNIAYFWIWDNSSWIY